MWAIIWLQHIPSNLTCSLALTPIPVLLICSPIISNPDHITVFRAEDIIFAGRTTGREDVQLLKEGSISGNEVLTHLFLGFIEVSLQLCMPFFCWFLPGQQPLGPGQNLQLGRGHLKWAHSLFDMHPCDVNPLKWCI